MNHTLIASCSYYKGEEQCPAEIIKDGKQSIWFHEKKWVEFGGTFDDNGEYEGNGLEDFETEDGVPMELKKVLFNRFIQDVWSVKESIPLFKKWYIKEYKGSI